ncbi:MAG: response regulator [Rhodocyclaceae bacterium]|nr:MAG: response regulator [Rhodocyclaceae bacterium]
MTVQTEDFAHADNATEIQEEASTLALELSRPRAEFSAWRTTAVGIEFEQDAATKEYAAQIHALTQQGWQLWDSDLDQTTALSEKARTLSTSGIFSEHPYELGIAESLTNLALVAHYRAEFEESVRLALESMRVCEKNDYRAHQAKPMLIASLSYVRLSNTSEAMTLLPSALRLSEEVADLSTQAKLVNCMAIAYLFHNEYQIALGYQERCDRLMRQIGEQRGLAVSLLNQAICHRELNNHQRSLECALEGMQIAEQINNPMVQMMSLATMGNAYSALQQFDLAIEHHLKSVELAKKLGSDYYLTDITYHLARCYSFTERHQLAIETLYDTLKMAETGKQKDYQYWCHELLAKNFEAQGNFKAALEHYKQFHLIKSEVFNLETEQKLKLLEVNFQTEAAKNEARILNEKNIELEKEVLERKRVEIELVNAKQRAEQANHSKSDFLSNVSHELRTPLNAILGFAELIAGHPNLEPTLLEHVQIVQQSGRHLLGLINNVLNLSKIEAGHISLTEQEYLLPRLLAEVIEMFQLSAMEKGLTLSLQQDARLPERFYGDDIKLRQVIINLVGNAVKFTKKGSITLYTKLLTAESDGFLQIVVEDSGIGIAEDELSLLFTPVTQTNSGRNAKEGTGLGLALSHKYVQLMGGELTVHSQVDVGTTFSLTIPIHQSVAQDERVQDTIHAFPRLAPGQPSHRLLVVDDNPINRKLLTTILKKTGFEVIEAINGKQALEHWRTFAPSLIWMDMVMPELDGYDATRAIKATEEGKHTVIIALTANAFEEDMEAALAAGCDAYIRKPYRSEELYRLLQQYLNIKFQ